MGLWGVIGVIAASGVAARPSDLDRRIVQKVQLSADLNVIKSIKDVDQFMQFINSKIHVGEATSTALNSIVKLGFTCQNSTIGNRTFIYCFFNDKQLIFEETWIVTIYETNGLVTEIGTNYVKSSI